MIILKILVSDPISDQGVEILKKEFDVDIATGLKPDQLIAKIGNYEALIVRSETQVTKDDLRHAVEQLADTRLFFVLKDWRLKESFHSCHNALAPFVLASEYRQLDDFLVHDQLFVGQ